MMLTFGWIDGSRSLNRSRILKFENFSNPNPDPDSKKFETGAETECVTTATSAFQKGPQFKLA